MFEMTSTLVDANPTDEHIRTALRSRGLLYPRWALLAIVFMALGAAIGYAIELYMAHRYCSLGPICSLDVLPGIVQIALIWLAFALLWSGYFIFGLSLLEGTDDMHELPSRFWFVVRAMRQFSDSTRISPLIIIIGGVCLAGLVAMVALHRFAPLAFAMGTLVVLEAALSVYWVLGEQTLQQPDAEQLRSVCSTLTPVVLLRSLLPLHAKPGGSDAGNNPPMEE